MSVTIRKVFSVGSLQSAYKGSECSDRVSFKGSYGSVVRWRSESRRIFSSITIKALKAYITVSTILVYYHKLRTWLYLSSVRGLFQVNSYNSFYINLTVLAIVPPALANAYIEWRWGCCLHTFLRNVIVACTPLIRRVVVRMFGFIISCLHTHS
jgi:hypothetical protein